MRVVAVPPSSTRGRSAPWRTASTLMTEAAEQLRPHRQLSRPPSVLQLLQLLDDRRPHLLRDNSTHRLTDPAQLDLQLEDVGAPLTPVEDGLKLLGAQGLFRDGPAVEICNAHDVEPFMGVFAA